MALNRVETIEHSDFILNKKIGSGNSSCVYEGTWKGNLVAVKVSEPFVSLLNEAKIMSNLDSPYIVKFYGMKSAIEKDYLCMEYMVGGSLNNALQNNTILKSQSETILVDASKALQYLHQNDVIHGDIHLNNIFLDASMCHAKIGDFGLTTYKQIGVSCHSTNSKEEDIGSFGTVIEAVSDYFSVTQHDYSTRLKQFGLWCKGIDSNAHLGNKIQQPSTDEIVETLENIIFLSN